MTAPPAFPMTRRGGSPFLRPLSVPLRDLPHAVRLIRRGERRRPVAPAGAAGSEKSWRGRMGFPDEKARSTGAGTPVNPFPRDALRKIAGTDYLPARSGKTGSPCSGGQSTQGSGTEAAGLSPAGAGHDGREGRPRLFTTARRLNRASRTCGRDCTDGDGQSGKSRAQKRPVTKRSPNLPPPYWFLSVRPPPRERARSSLTDSGNLP